MKHILTRLFEHKQLDRKEAKDVLVKISNGDFNEAQIAAFISVYLMRSISVNELLGFRDALLELCRPFDLEGMESIDIVGTGGDGKNTFNISTLSSVVVAGAGYKVTKHGNYGVSSSCGSSNVLEYLGYEFTNDTDILRKQLDKANICFLHAPLFHPAMKAVAPVRKQLGVKTFFNMLGPLVNPAQPAKSLLGVFNLELARLYQYIFQKTEERDAAIVYSMDGYDEISLTSPFKLRQNNTEQLLRPSDIGKSLLQQSELHGGGDVPSSAKIFMDVLSGSGTSAQIDVVSTNAGVAIHCLKPKTDIKDCIKEANKALMNGNALKQFKILLN